MRHAAIEFRSERYLRVDGKRPDEYHDDLAGLYRCGDGRFARLHTNLPHHCSGLLKLLGVPHDKAAVQRALDGMTAEALESAAAEAGLVVTACRSFAEWDRHPQGQAVATLPLLSIEKIGEAPANKLAAADRPLTGVKVLDLTRIIAGPVCGRTLGGAWRRRAADHCKTSGVDAAAGDGYRPGEIIGVDRSARGGRPRDAGRAGARGRRLRARLPARRHRRARVLAARRGAAPAPASSMPRSALMGMRAHGPTGADSIRWCRPRAASTPPKPKRSVRQSRKNCRRKNSIMPPAICWPSR